MCRALHLMAFQRVFFHSFFYLTDGLCNCSNSPPGLCNCSNSPPGLCNSSNSIHGLCNSSNSIHGPVSSVLWYSCFCCVMVYVFSPLELLTSGIVVNLGLCCCLRKWCCSADLCVVKCSADLSLSGSAVVWLVVSFVGSDP